MSKTADGHKTPATTFCWLASKSQQQPLANFMLGDRCRLRAALRFCAEVARFLIIQHNRTYHWLDTCLTKNDARITGLRTYQFCGLQRLAMLLMCQYDIYINLCHYNLNKNIWIMENQSFPESILSTRCNRCGCKYQCL